MLFCHFNRSEPTDKSHGIKLPGVIASCNQLNVNVLKPGFYTIAGDRSRFLGWLVNCSAIVTIIWKPNFHFASNRQRSQRLPTIATITIARIESDKTANQLSTEQQKFPSDRYFRVLSKSKASMQKPQGGGTFFMQIHGVYGGDGYG